MKTRLQLVIETASVMVQERHNRANAATTYLKANGVRGSQELTEHYAEAFALVEFWRHANELFWKEMAERRGPSRG